MSSPNKELQEEKKSTEKAVEDRKILQRRERGIGKEQHIKRILKKKTKQKTWCYRNPEKKVFEKGTIMLNVESSRRISASLYQPTITQRPCFTK